MSATQPLPRNAIAAYATISKAAKASGCVRTFYPLLKIFCATPTERTTRAPAKASCFRSHGLPRQREGSGSTTSLALGFALFSLATLPPEPKYRARGRWE